MIRNEEKFLIANDRKLNGHLVSFVSFKLVQLVGLSCREQSYVIAIRLSHKM